MRSANYHFTTEWWVDATIEEVSDILGDAASLPSWWPSVYLEVKVREPGDSRGVGKRWGARAKVTYDWTIRLTKPLLRSLSFLFKPIFSANHRWT